MKKLPTLTRYKRRECPTCKAKPGDNCVSVGAKKGAKKGNVMSTSVHTARRSATKPKSHKAKPSVDGWGFPLPVPTTPTKALDDAWAASQAKQEREKEIAPLVFGCIDELRMYPDLLGVSQTNQNWDVRASRTIPEGFNISILKR
jgi:hypothetical protein